MNSQSWKFTFAADDAKSASVYPILKRAVGAGSCGAASRGHNERFSNGPAFSVRGRDLLEGFPNAAQSL